MITQNIKFAIGNEILAGRLVTDQKEHKPQLLFFHGAGQSHKGRSLKLAEQLAKRGISSFAFDFSGHGESTGTLEASSLAKRTNEAKSALQFLDLNKPITVCGFSMGAYIAIQLLKFAQVETLGLFYPAIYSRKVFNLPHGKERSELLRQLESWKDTDATEILQDFKGNLLIYIGDNDEVIPKGIITLLDDSSPNAASKKIQIIPGGTHHLLDTIYPDQQLLESIVNDIAHLSP